jgi:hypothetical protein
MMIRKLGTFGGRFGKGRSSLKGISNMFNRDDSGGGGATVGDSVSEFGVPGSSPKLKKKDKKKASLAPATASVAHVEVERGEDARAGAATASNKGMTPAAALVQLYAEQQARQAEQDKANDTKGKSKGRKWGFGNSQASSAPSPASPSSSASTLMEDRVSPRTGADEEGEDDLTDRLDDSTPRQSMDFDSSKFHHLPLPSSGEFGGSFFDDDTASFGRSGTPVGFDDDGSMYEGKITVVPVPRNARPVRGILKSECGQQFFTRVSGLDI